MATTIKSRLLHTLLVISVFSVSTAFGQGKWKSGYVIKKNGDTLKGSIAYIEKLRTPTAVVYRQEKGAPKQRFLPSEISEFVVHMPLQDLYFKSFSADIDISEYDVTRIDNIAAAKLVNHRFFAQLLVEGPRSLYTYKDTIVGRKHYLIEYPEGILTDLISKRYYLDESRTMIASNDEYKKQLEKFFAPCPLISFKQLNDLQYNSTSLTDIAKEYNKCNDRGTGAGYEYKREKTKATFGVLFGPTRTSMRSHYPDFRGFTFPVDNSFTGAVFVNLVLPHSERRWSIYNELIYTRCNTTGNAYYPYSGPMQMEINNSFIKLVNVLRYQYPRYGIKPFIQLGISNGVAVSSSAKTHDILSSGARPEAVRSEQSLVTGIGISYRKFEAEIRSDRASEFHGYPGAVLTTRSLMFLLKHSIY